MSLRCLAAPAALAAVLSACAPASVAPPSAFSTSSSSATPRRPDGVVVDPPTAYPPALESASASSTSVTLRAAPDDAAIERFVLSFFDAISRESIEDLGALVARDALTRANPRGPGAPLLETWRLRLRRLAYEPTAREPAVRGGDVEIFREPLAGRERSLAAPPETEPGDVVIRVRPRPPRGTTDRLFGSEMLLLLRRDAAGLRVRSALEEYAVP